MKLVILWFTMFNALGCLLLLDSNEQKDASPDLHAADTADAAVDRDSASDAGEDVTDVADATDVTDSFVAQDVRDAIVDTAQDVRPADTGVDAMVVDAGIPHLPVRVQYDLRSDTMWPIRDFFFRILRDGGSVLLPWTSGRCIGGIRSIGGSVIECLFDSTDIAEWSLTGLPPHSIIQWYPEYVPTYPDGGHYPVCPTDGSISCPYEYPFRYTVYKGMEMLSLRPPASPSLGYGPNLSCGQRTMELDF